MKFTRFEKGITSIKGYALVAGDEVLAMIINEGLK